MADTQITSTIVFGKRIAAAPACPLDELSSSLMFPVAAECYLKMRSVNAKRARYVSVNTIKSYKRYISALSLFFKDVPLKKICLNHLRDYQAARVEGSAPFIRRRRPHQEPAPCPCLPQQVNQELCFLRAVMRRAGCKMDALKFYEDLQPIERDTQRSLSPEEHRLWLDVSKQKERWAVIHWYSILAFESTMSTNELRGLRIGDINLENRLISVPWASSKNKYRHRSIPLESADALWACERLLERANRLGAHAPQHYVFPFREARSPYSLPDRPMSESGLKKLWQEVREATGLGWFRPYDTRHTAITRMAEAGIPVLVIMAKAGHVSPKMSQHYTHVSEAAQRHWNRAQEARPTRRAACVSPIPVRTTETSVASTIRPLPLKEESPVKKQFVSTTFTYSGFYL